MRKDIKFNNSAQLIRQMNKDVISAKKGLKTKLLSALSMNVMSIDLMRRFSKVVGLPAVDESIKTPI